MNYFELHIGDYDSATAHLSVLEDGIYGRLLRVCYRTEAPLPAEVSKICRLVRAVSKPERDAVVQVLDEFFKLEADGWHNARCDAEVERFVAGEPEREVKAANEKNRLQKHREERAALFKQLTDAGQHAAWNIPIAELRSLVERIGKAPPQTPAPPFPATAPATPATATQAPVPNSQLPTPKDKDKGAHPDATTLRALGGEKSEVEPGDRQPGPGSVYGAAALAMRSRGMSDVTPTDPRLRALVDAGIGLDELSNIAIEAVDKGKSAPWAYKVVAARRADAQAIAVTPKPEAPPWHETRDGVSSRGQQLGIGAWQDFSNDSIRRGKTPSWDAYRRRVIDADADSTATAGAPR